MLAQDALRVVHLGRGNIHDPLKVVEILVNGKPIQHGEPFQSGPDWIDKLTVVVKNNSTKAVTCVQVGIDFPELRDQSYPAAQLVMIPVTAGVIPDHQFYTSSGRKIDVLQQPAISVGPGQTLQLAVSSSTAQIKSLLEAGHNVSKVTQCLIWIRMAFFSDGTRWSGVGGVLSKPDPQVPGKYDPITQNEFEGDTTSH